MELWGILLCTPCCHLPEGPAHGVKGSKATDRQNPYTIQSLTPQGKGPSKLPLSLPHSSAPSQSPQGLESPSPLLAFAPQAAAVEKLWELPRNRRWPPGWAGAGPGELRRHRSCLLHACCHVHQLRGSGRVTRQWRGWLCCLFHCLPAGRRAGGGARERPAAAWHLASLLLGNQESQAQLIKPWAEALQEKQGPQGALKPAPRASLQSLSVQAILPSSIPAPSDSLPTWVNAPSPQ